MVHSLLTLWEAGVAAHLTQQCLVHCKHGLLTCGALMRLHTAHIHAWFCVACSTAASAASGGTQLPLAACRSTRSLNQGPISPNQQSGKHARHAPHDGRPNIA